MTHKPCSACMQVTVESGGAEKFSLLFQSRSSLLARPCTPSFLNRCPAAPNRNLSDKRSRVDGSCRSPSYCFQVSPRALWGLKSCHSGGWLYYCSQSSLGHTVGVSSGTLSFAKLEHRTVFDEFFSSYVANDTYLPPLQGRAVQSLCLVSHGFPTERME